MNKYRRRGIIGLVAGLAGGVALAATLGNIVTGLLLGGLVGVLYSIAFRPSPGVYADRVVTAAAFGVPLWLLVNVLAIPLLSGHPPQWTGDGMRSVFSALVGWMVFGAVMGLLVQALSDLALWRFGPEYEPPPRPQEVKTRIVVLGGGFAGVTTAGHLEEEFGPD